jgi:hypothetical protein
MDTNEMNLHRLLAQKDAEIERLQSLLSRVLAAEGRCPTRLLIEISRVLEDKQ